MTLELSMISDDGTVGAQISIPHFQLYPKSEVEPMLTELSLRLKRDLTQYTVANVAVSGNGANGDTE